MSAGESTAVILFSLFAACSIWGWVMFIRTVREYRRLKKRDRSGEDWPEDSQAVEEEHDDH